MKRRHTAQKELVLNAVREMHCHATAEEVYQAVHRKSPTIGKGTVYRNLNILSDEGEIRRVELPDGPDRYDHLVSRHYHIRCTNCGRLFDADTDEGPAMETLVRNTHGFRFLDYDILFKGICPDCLPETGNKEETDHGSQSDV